MSPKKVMEAAYSKKRNQKEKKLAALSIATSTMLRAMAQKMSVERARYGTCSVCSRSVKRRTIRVLRRTGPSVNASIKVDEDERRGGQVRDLQIPPKV
jgi:RNA polymerase-binding transcription factor DksA